MASSFKTVGILGRIKTPGVKETLKALVQFLQDIGQKFLIDAETASSLDNPSFAGTPRDELNKHCDLVIVVGGDGSLLRAAHQVVNDEIPVLGVNRGRLGFLTDIPPTELTKIKAILEGDYLLEKRFLITATVEYEGRFLGECDALNEIALIPDSAPHMNEFEIYTDDQFLCSQNSDGVIVATPTGSTAYALSGGGPVLHPQLDAMVIVPMFPHTLSIRPIVIEGSHVITIKIAPNNGTTPRITADSQEFINTPPGSVITIRKKTKHLHLIHPRDYDYYEALRSKLHWGRKLNYSE